MAHGPFHQNSCIGTVRGFEAVSRHHRAPPLPAQLHCWIKPPPSLPWYMSVFDAELYAASCAPQYAASLSLLKVVSLGVDNQAMCAISRPGYLPPPRHLQSHIHSFPFGLNCPNTQSQASLTMNLQMPLQNLPLKAPLGLQKIYHGHTLICTHRSVASSSGSGLGKPHLSVARA